MKKRILNIIIGCILLTGCTGPFELTKAVHSWQTSFEEKWIDELAFIGCIPVYGLSLLSDSIILNNMEFWTGENPMTVQIDDNGVSATLSKTANGVVRIDRAEKTCFIERTEDGVIIKDASGRLIGLSQTQGQLVKITDAEGNLIKIFHKS